jgi:hypothetical protein
MILCIGQVLDEGRLEELRQRLAARAFVDGAATAGWHAKLVQHNRQAEGGPETQALQAEVPRRWPGTSCSSSPADPAGCGRSCSAAMSPGWSMAATSTMR